MLLSKNVYATQNSSPRRRRRCFVSERPFLRVPPRELAFVLPAHSGTRSFYARVSCERSRGNTYLQCCPHLHRASIPCRDFSKRHSCRTPAGCPHLDGTPRYGSHARLRP